jgi:hypothetical protein
MAWAAADVPKASVAAGSDSFRWIRWTTGASPAAAWASAVVSQTMPPASDGPTCAGSPQGYTEVAALTAVPTTG